MLLVVEVKPTSEPVGSTRPLSLVRRMLLIVETAATQFTHTMPVVAVVEGVPTSELAGLPRPLRPVRPMLPLVETWPTQVTYTMPMLPMVEGEPTTKLASLPRPLLLVRTTLLVMEVVTFPMVATQATTTRPTQAMLVPPPSKRW
ncbi:hypothetical protein AMTRI_Chr02g218770 [Amborella trichopoda]